MIKNDCQLSALFSTVPSNQIVVLEGVDAQTNILLKRYNSLSNTRGWKWWTERQQKKKW